MSKSTNLWHQDNFVTKVLNVTAHLKTWLFQWMCPFGVIKVIILIEIAVITILSHLCYFDKIFNSHHDYFDSFNLSNFCFIFHFPLVTYLLFELIFLNFSFFFHFFFVQIFWSWGVLRQQVTIPQLQLRLYGKK